LRGDQQIQGQTRDQVEVGKKIASLHSILKEEKYKGGGVTASHCSRHERKRCGGWKPRHNVSTHPTLPSIYITHPLKPSKKSANNTRLLPKF